MQHSEDVDCFSTNSGIPRSVHRRWNASVGADELASTFLIVSLACSNQQFPQTAPGYGLEVREVKELFSKDRLLQPSSFRTNQFTSMDTAALCQLISLCPVNVPV